MSAEDAARCLQEASVLLGQGSLANAYSSASTALQSFDTLLQASQAADAAWVMAAVLSRQRRAAEAVDLASKRAYAARSLGDKVVQAKCLLIVAEHAAEPAEGLKFARKAMDWLEVEQVDTSWYAWSCLVTARLLIATAARGDADIKLWREADRVARRAVNLYKSIPDSVGESRSLLVQAEAKEGQHDSAAARSMAEEAVELARSSGGIAVLDEIKALAMTANFCLRGQPPHPKAATRFSEEAWVVMQQQKLLHDDGGSTGDLAIDELRSMVISLRVQSQNEAGAKAAHTIARSFASEGKRLGDVELRKEMLLAAARAGINNSESRQQGTVAAEEAMALAEASEDRPFFLEALRVLIALKQANHQHLDVISLAQQAAATCEDLGKPPKERVEMLLLAVKSMLAASQVQAAQKLLDALLPMCAGDVRLQVDVLLELCEVHTARGDFKELVKMATSAVEAARKGSLRKQEADAFRHLATAHREGKEVELALVESQTALALYSELGCKEDEVYMLLCTAEQQADEACRIETQRLQRGIEGATSSQHWQVRQEQALSDVSRAKALATSPKLGQSRGHLKAQVLYIQAQVELKTHLEEAALRTAAEAMREMWNCWDLYGIAKTFVLQAQVHAKLGSRRDAESCANEALHMYYSLEDADGEEVVTSLLKDLEAAASGVLPLEAGAAGAELDDQQSPLDAVSEALTAKVRSIVVDIIGSSAELELDAPLLESGLTSNTATLLQIELAREVSGAKVPQTLAFDYPSIRAVTGCLMSSMGARQ